MAFVDPTAKAIINGLQGELPEMIGEAIQEAARVLRPHNRAYKTNGDGWQLGRRAVLEYMVSYSFGQMSLSYHRVANLTSIDNAFHFLDGKGPAKHPHTLRCAIDTAL